MLNVLMTIIYVFKKIIPKLYLAYIYVSDDAIEYSLD